ncbi:MAG: hypothetical protein QXF26_04420 [Candidatus Bathyarchaeia archaeon]
MSERILRIRVKVGENEVEVSGTESEVINTLSNVSEVVKKVVEALGAARAQGSTTETVQDILQPAQTEEYPSLSLDPGIACPEAIVKLLATEWGRRRPRALGELLEAMKVNAIHYPEGTVKGRLTDLTKKGVLRRIKGERGYGYILVKS